MAASRLSPILFELADTQCDFIVVGGVAAVLDGAPLQTFDLDIVPSQTEENVERLLSAPTALALKEQLSGGKDRFVLPLTPANSPRKTKALVN